MAPFRIGSTSYVYPDDILPNVHKLAPLVDDIELVLFEVDEGDAAGQSNLPTPELVSELRALALEHSLTYTVHLPLDLDFGDANAFGKGRRVIEATRALDPYAYVMHLDGRALLQHPTREQLAAWQNDASEAVAQIAAWVGEPRRVCVENLERWDPEYMTGLVVEQDVSRCIDIGHLWVDGCDPLPHLEAHLDRTRVIHLHGVGTRDHQSLTQMPEAEVRRILRPLVERSFNGVLTLEVFGVDDFLSSRKVLVKIVEQLYG